jgi:2-hydroxy-3-keto-5-methylthiopentenyl-1-phosphate phosphatase
VLSSGFEELIRPVLDKAGVDGVDVVANAVDVGPDGWRVRWHEQKICAACGEACKRGGLPADGEVVYVGDGIRTAVLPRRRINYSHAPAGPLLGRAPA